MNYLLEQIFAYDLFSSVYYYMSNVLFLESQKSLNVIHLQKQQSKFIKSKDSYFAGINQSRPAYFTQENSHDAYPWTNRFIHTSRSHMPMSKNVLAFFYIMVSTSQSGHIFLM